MLRKLLTGDQVFIPLGVYLKSSIDDVEMWCDKCRMAIVIGEHPREIELDDAVCCYVVVFIADLGIYYASRREILTPDEYTNPGRLFYHRLREW